MKYIITSKENESGKLFEGQIKMESTRDLTEPNNRELLCVLATYWINKKLHEAGSETKVNADILMRDDRLNIEIDNDYRENEPVAPSEPTKEEPMRTEEPVTEDLSPNAREFLDSNYGDLWGSAPSEIRRY